MGAWGFGGDFENDFVWPTWKILLSGPLPGDGGLVKPGCTHPGLK